MGREIHCSHSIIELNQMMRANQTFGPPAQHDRDIKDEECQNRPMDVLPQFLLGNLIDLQKIYRILNLNIKNILLSRETIISHLPIRVSDPLTIRTFLKDVYEQQASSNPIGFVLLESIGCKNNDLAFYSERVLAVRGGFQRGRP